MPTGRRKGQPVHDKLADVVAVAAVVVVVAMCYHWISLSVLATLVAFEVEGVDIAVMNSYCRSHFR